MWCRPVLGLALTLAFTGCTKDEPRMPATCTGAGPAAYERALRAAPGAVRLPGGVTISTCLRRVRTGAELQELGSVVHAAAEDLAGRALGAGGGPGAATAAAGQLGYLAGAVATGSVRSNGISAELARRVALTAAAVADATPALRRTVRAGQDAGQARG